MRAYLLTIKYRVVQFLPGFNISEQFESMYLTILQQILFLLLFEVVVIDAWSRYFVELLSRLVRQLTISFHTLLCMTSHKTMKKHEDFEGMVISLILPQKFAIRTWFCNCPQYLCLFRIFFECSPSFHDLRKMLVLPKSTSLLSTFHIGSRFCFFPANFLSSTYTDKNNPFSR